MFTGIVETTARITNIITEDTNRTFWLECSLANQFKIDQSISHNGICLTVTEVLNNRYSVTAIQETLNKTNAGLWQTNSIINIERCMPANGRFDGHIVQGHIDQTGVCTNIEDQHGSWLFTFEYDSLLQHNITVEKGSISINGISLTVCTSQTNSFQVAIIPYTFYHTNFKNLCIGNSVNLEFDILGKYIQKVLFLSTKNTNSI